MRRLLPLTTASLLLACSTPAPQEVTDRPADQRPAVTQPAGLLPAPQVEAQPAPAMHADPLFIEDGKSFVMTSALAYTRGTSQVRVELSNAKTRCADLGPHGSRPQGGYKYATITFLPILQPDGTRRWMATQLFWQGTNIAHGIKPEQLNGLTITPPIDGQPVGLSMDYTLEIEGDIVFESVAKRYELRGEVLAQPCGGIVSEAPNAVPQDMLTATLAGQPLTFQGAILTGSPDDPRLELTTSPRDCGGWQASDLEVLIHLKQKRGKHKVDTSGDMLSALYTDNAPLNIKQDKKDPTKLTINGTYNIDDQPLVLRGAIKALNCMR